MTDIVCPRCYGTLDVDHNHTGKVIITCPTCKISKVYVDAEETDRRFSFVLDRQNRQAIEAGLYQRELAEANALLDEIGSTKFPPDYAVIIADILAKRKGGES